MNRLKLFLIFALTSLSLQAAAVSIEELATRATIVDVKISPTGEYIGLRMFQNGKHNLVFMDRSNAKMLGAVNFGSKAEVGRFYWANHERAVMEVYEVASNDTQPKYYGELFAANYDGSKGEMIFGVRSHEMQTGSLIQKKRGERAWAEIIDMLPHDDQHILVSSTLMSKAIDKNPRAQKLNIYKGLDSNPLKVSAFPMAKFYADKDGEIRIVTSYKEDQKLHVETRPDITGPWMELDENAFGSQFVPAAIAEDGGAVYIMDDISGDTLGLYKLALDGSSYEKIYSDERLDITELLRTTDGNGVFAMRVDDGYPKYLLFSQTYPEAQLFKKLLATFPGRTISITSQTRDGRYWVAQTSSDIDPGSFYLFDSKEQRLTLLFRAKPEINSEELAPMEPVSFSSFDGLELSGYFTAAIGVKESKAPMVVLLHGGPRSRDYWDFNPQVQALATRGYSVLQVNYRGSSGYGKTFLNAGNRQWGDAIQQDVIAATKWAIKERAVDGERVCIMGASFGAYSALQSALLAPDLYRCVIANAGIYDLPMMYKKGDIEYRYLGKAYLEEAIGSNEEELRRYSPVHNIERLEAPLLLAHGGRDRRAPYDQAKALQKALDKHDKSYRSFIESAEGHGFYNDENRTKYFNAVLDFLADSPK